MSNKIAVYLLSYRRPELILQTVNSVLAQKNISFDFIISENSGHDEVYRLIRPYEEQGLLKIIRQQPTRESIEHFNQLIQEASHQYEYFMLFHDDDIMHADCVTTLYQELQKYPNYVAVASNAIILGTNTLFNPYLTTQTTLESISQLVKSYLKPRLGHPPFPSYMYRSTKIQDCRMNIHEGGKHSDVTFLAHLLTKGPLLWIPQALIDYRIHSQNDSATINLADIWKLSCFYFRAAPQYFLLIAQFLIKNSLKKYFKS